MKRRSADNITDEQLSRIYDQLEKWCPTGTLVAAFTVDHTASKERARVRIRNGKPYAYTPTETTRAELNVGWRFRQAAPGHRVDGESRFGVAATFTGARSTQDTDNMIKLVLDGLSGVAWANDRQVDELHARKTPGDTHRSDITIYRIGDTP